MHKSEQKVIDDYEKEGYLCLKNGCPDLLVYKEDMSDAFFVEVKDMNRKLKPNQQKYIQILQKMGNKVFVKDNTTQKKSLNERKKDYFEKIISLLRYSGRTSTSKIASYVGIPNEYALKYLSELLILKLITKEEETNAVYWKILNNEDENEKI